MSTSDWKLRRIAPRAKRICERHKDTAPALASYVESVPPACDAFIASFDALHLAESQQAVELAQSGAATKLLYASLKAWAGQVVAADVIEGFSAADYGRRREVPDDVVADSQRLMGRVKQHAAQDPESLPFVDALVADLSQGIENVTKERIEAEQAKDALMKLVNENRINAEHLTRLMIGFRRSLGAVIGRNHPDYQALRASKIERDVLEEGEEADLPPQLVPPKSEDADLADVG